MLVKMNGKMATLWVLGGAIEQEERKPVPFFPILHGDPISARARV